MKLSHCFLGVVAILLVGCGSVRMHVDSEWKEAPRSFTVLVTEPFVKNEDDLADDFKSADAFKEWFASYVGEAFASYSVVAPTVELVSDESLLVTNEKLGEDFVKVPVPKFDENDGLSGTVVTIHPVRFWRDHTPCPAGTFCVGGKNLNAHVLYSVTSAEDRRKLAFGYGHAKDSFSVAMTKGNWEDVVSDIVKMVLDGTPLKK